MYYFCTGIVLVGIIIFKFSDIFKRLGWVEYESRKSNNHKYATTPLDEDEITDPLEGPSADPPIDSNVEFVIA